MTTPTKPTLPANFAFDLALAKLGWPVVADSDPADVRILCFDGPGPKPIVGIHNGSVQCWRADGRFADPCDNTVLDLFLSADTDDPLLRRAVEAAHAAGEPISLCHTDTAHQTWGSREMPGRLNWELNIIYLPTRLLSQLPKPEPASLIAPGHNPDKLTLAQVGEGYALLTEAEMNGRSTQEDRYWQLGWHPVAMVGTGLCALNTYRRPLPAPFVPWSKPSDLGFPWPLMKHKDRPRLNTITSADKDGLKIEGWGNVAWSEIRNWLNSRDGINFEHCTVKEAK